MGAKGSKAALVSRFRSTDFFFGESATFGMQSPPTAMHTLELAARRADSAVAAAAATAGGNEPGRLLAVGCEDGSVYVYGAEGIAVRLFEEPAEPPTAASSWDESAASTQPSSPSSRVLFVSFLSDQLIVSVHPTAVKLWSVASMMEVFALHMADLPPLPQEQTGSHAHHQLTAAAVSTEYDSRYVWLGTASGAVLLFDSRLQRLSRYFVPLLPEAQPAGAKDANAAHASALAAAAAGLLPPTAVTCLAQLPTDSSQLLIGYASDVVLSWHISTRKLHRAYKRAGCGGVTALCWELGPNHAAGASSVADRFAVGHRNGIINVWRRKYPHAPEATLFLSNAPGPRAPITRLRWSTRSSGFFVCGGHVLPTQTSSAAAATATGPAPAAVVAPAAAVDQGCVVFVSGGKFENRKICAPSMVLDAEGAPRPDWGVIDFEQILMTPNGAAAPATTSAGGPAPPAKVTPAFICVLASGAVSVVLPTVSPAVPPLPLTDLHEAHADGVLLLSASGSADETAALRAVISTLRAIHPRFRLWGSLVRSSLAQQRLWPLTAGVDSAAMALIDAQEEALFQRMRIVSTKEAAGDPADPATAAPPSDSPVAPAAPLPALLLTSHSGAAASVRLYDATSPFQLDLLCVLPLTRLMPPSVRVTAMLFCVPRRELMIGTSVGEVLLFRLREAQTPAATTAAAAVEPPTQNVESAPAPDAVSAAAPAEPTAPDAAATATPAVAPSVAGASSSSSAPAPSAPEWTFDLAHRLSFSAHPIHSTLLYSQEVDKYFIADAEGAFALLRPDTGVAVRQTLASAARISSAHFSSEALVQPKGPSLQSPQYLYVCGADGSVSLYCAAAEARLAALPSLSGEEARPGDAVQFMQTVVMRTEGGAQVVSPRVATSSARGAASASAAAGGAATAGAADDSQSYVIACTQQSVKLLCAGGRAPESLLSLRTPEPIRLAFLVASPHLIAQRDEAAPATTAAPAAGAPGNSSSAAAAAPASELCLCVVDAQSSLHVLSVNLKVLLLAPLGPLCGRGGAGPSPLSLSVSGDGRMAALRCASAVSLAQMFPNKQYNFLAPPPQLLPPPSDAEIAAAAKATSAAQREEDAALQSAAAPATGWFSALLPAAVAHSVLFSPPLFDEEQIDAARSARTGGGRPDAEEDGAEEAETSEPAAANPRASAAPAGRSGPSGVGGPLAGGRTAGGAAPSSSASAVRGQVGEARDTMAQNTQLAAANLRRGQEVADKSEIMANHADDFLKAARKLRQQQESSWW